MVLPAGYAVVKENRAVGDFDIVQRKKEGQAGHGQRFGRVRPGAATGSQGPQIVRVVLIADKRQAKTLNVQVIAGEAVTEQGDQIHVHNELVNMQEGGRRRCVLIAPTTVFGGNGGNIAKLQAQGEGVEVGLLRRQAKARDLLKGIREVAQEE